MPSLHQLQQYSDMKEAKRKAIAYLGSPVNMLVSTRDSNKYMIQNPHTGRWIHFGAMGYEDYTKHRDEERRQRYLKRATAIKGDWKSNKYSPNNLSINILW